MDRGHTGPVETQHCPQQTLGDRLEACRLARPGIEMELSVPAGAGRDEKAIGTQEQPIRRSFVEAADRKSDVSGKSVSGRVDRGGRRIIKKKKNNTTNDTSTD